MGSSARVTRDRELPLAERPRERLATRGATGLSASELIALVWGSRSSGARGLGLAGDVLAAHGGLDALARATPAEIELLPGVGSVRAAQLAAALELGRRAICDWPVGRWAVRTPRDLADRLMLQMGGLAREELRVVLLNTKNAVLDVRTLYQGSVSTAVVRTGELFHDAIRQHATGIIVVHNHPSGDPEPSAEDLHLTAEVVAAGRLLDVAVLDHLIIGRQIYVSLRERGLGFSRSEGC